METRTVNQIKIWKLVMHARNRDDWDLVAVSADRDVLTEWYKNQQCDEYEEYIEGLGSYKKNFKQGTRLEWYEPVEIENEVMDYEYGVSWEWINETELPILKNFNSWLE
jgi:hypothetical protein